MTVVGVLFVVSGLSMAASAGTHDSVTLCHYAGQEGSDSYKTLTLAPNAASGHIDENGTPTAGHENDYLGECQGSETSTTTSLPTTTTTVLESTTTTAPSTTTTVLESTTTTAPSTTTTVLESTTTTVLESTTTTSGSSSSAPQSTTTTAAEAEPASALAAETPTTVASSDPSPEQASEDSSETNSPAGDVLPYTGASTYLIAPGVLLTIFGVLVVFVSGGFESGQTGAHLAAEVNRLRLGFHRGRHQA